MTTAPTSATTATARAQRPDGSRARRPRRRRLLALLAAGSSVVALAGAVPATADDHRGVRRTTAPVTSWWDGTEVVGSSRLVRTPHGVTAVVRASGIPAGHAVTLWAIVFNEPEACGSDPCAAPADVFAPGTEADFHFLSGHVVGHGPAATFAGHLRAGDTGASGKAELAAAGVAPVVAVPLRDPSGAQVLLALHDHGPAATGRLLRSQLSSFLGGCEVFNGPDGFASGPQDIPDAPGECSTFTRSTHR